MSKTYSFLSEELIYLSRVLLFPQRQVAKYKSSSAHCDRFQSPLSQRIAIEVKLELGKHALFCCVELEHDNWDRCSGCEQQCKKIISNRKGSECWVTRKLDAEKETEVHNINIVHFSILCGVELSCQVLQPMKWYYVPNLFLYELLWYGTSWYICYLSVL